MSGRKTPPRASGSRLEGTRLTQAELMAAIQRIRYRSAYMIIIGFTLVAGIFYLITTFHYVRRYDHYRALAATRSDVDAPTHRRLVPSDLNARQLYAEAQGQFGRDVIIRLTERGPTRIIVVDRNNGKVLQRRRVRRSDLDFNNISIKYQHETGETGNVVNLVYDSDGVAHLIIAHSDDQ